MMHLFFSTTRKGVDGVFFVWFYLLGESAQHIPPCLLTHQQHLERNLFWSETLSGLEVQRLLHIFHLFWTARGVVWGRSGLLFWDSAVRSGRGEKEGVGGKVGGV